MVLIYTITVKRKKNTNHQDNGRRNKFIKIIHIGWGGQTQYKSKHLALHPQQHLRCHGIFEWGKFIICLLSNKNQKFIHQFEIEVKVQLRNCYMWNILWHIHLMNLSVRTKETTAKIVKSHAHSQCSFVR